MSLPQLAIFWGQTLYMKQETYNCKHTPLKKHLAKDGVEFCLVLQIKGLMNAF